MSSPRHLMFGYHITVLNSVADRERSKALPTPLQGSPSLIVKPKGRSSKYERDIIRHREQLVIDHSPPESRPACWVTDERVSPWRTDSDDALLMLKLPYSPSESYFIIQPLYLSVIALDLPAERALYDHVLISPNLKPTPPSSSVRSAYKYTRGREYQKC